MLRLLLSFLVGPRPGEVPEREILRRWLSGAVRPERSGIHGEVTR
jgi:hypothetical protein